LLLNVTSIVSFLNIYTQSHNKELLSTIPKAVVEAVQMLVPPWAYNSGAIMTMSAVPIVVKSEKLFLSNFHRKHYPAKSTIILLKELLAS
jgi:hypothetical protein